MLMNPNANSPYPMPKQSHGPVIAALLLAIGLILSLAFGIWAFVGMQSNKSDLDSKIEAASSVAVKKAEDVKEAEFAEREKDPTKAYSGSATFGSLSFNYPKTWSVYLEEDDSGTVLDYYAHPNYISGLGKENSFAFRAQILSNDYSSEAEKIQKLASSAKATVTAFTPTNVPTALGLRAVGEVATGKQGVMIIIPQRDKTIKLWTESNEFVTDFDKLTETINFIP